MKNTIITEDSGKEFYDDLSSQKYSKGTTFPAKVPLELLNNEDKKFKGDLTVQLPINTNLINRYIKEYVGANVELKKKFDVYANWYSDFNKLIFDNMSESDGCLFLAAVAYCSANTALDVNILEAAKLFVAVKTDFNRGKNGKIALAYISKNINKIDGSTLPKLEKLANVRSSYASLLVPKLDPQKAEKSSGRGKDKVLHMLMTFSEKSQ